MTEPVATLLELFVPYGEPRTRAMFGGHGIWLEDRMVALVGDGRGYLKTDAESRPAFRTAGAEPFRYARRDGSVTTTSYWSVPPDADASPEAFAPWARLAIQAALRAAGRR